MGPQKLNLVLHMYSVSSLETTIFREIISLIRVNFRSTFLSSYLTPYFETLMGGNTYPPSIAPIRVSNYKINVELKNVRLKFFLILEEIVVYKLETLYSV